MVVYKSYFWATGCSGDNKKTMTTIKLQILNEMLQNIKKTCMKRDDRGNLFTFRL